MPTLHQQIVKKFLGKLGGSKEFDPEKIEKLRAVLADGKKLKAEELVKVFVESGGDIK
jgi:hypothetical protein